MQFEGTLEDGTTEISALERGLPSNLRDAIQRNGMQRPHDDHDYKHFDNRGVALPIPIVERRIWYATCSICNCKKVRVAEQKMDGEKGLGPVKFLL